MILSELYIISQVSDFHERESGCLAMSCSQPKWASNWYHIAARCDEFYYFHYTKYGIIHPFNNMEGTEAIQIDSQIFKFK